MRERDMQIFWIGGIVCVVIAVVAIFTYHPRLPKNYNMKKKKLQENRYINKMRGTILYSRIAMELHHVIIIAWLNYIHSFKYNVFEV